LQSFCGMSYPAIIIDKSERDKRKLHKLENRLRDQEKVSNRLLNRSFDLEDQLKGSMTSQAINGAWNDHVINMTSQLRELSSEVENMKQQIAMANLNEQQYTQQAIGNVQQATTQGVTDLRGRVVRCDTNIAQLAQEMRNINRKTIQDTERLHQLADSSIEKTKSMQQQMDVLSRRMDKLLNEQEHKITQVEGSSSQQLEHIDLRMKAIIEDVRMQIDSNKKLSESERSRLEQQMSNLLQLNTQNITNKQEVFESRINERMRVLEKYLEDNKNDVNKIRHDLEKSNRNDQVLDRVGDFQSQIGAEMAKLKKEYRDGFTSLKESINSTNKLTDTKFKLFKEKVNRDVKRTLNNLQ